MWLILWQVPRAPVCMHMDLRVHAHGPTASESGGREVPIPFQLDPPIVLQVNGIRTCLKPSGVLQPFSGNIFSFSQISVAKFDLNLETQATINLI